jgi:hypothetical protein
MPIEPHRARHGLQARRIRAKSSRRLDGNNQLSKLFLRVKFADGREVAKPAKSAHNRHRLTDQVITKNRR